MYVRFITATIDPVAGTRQGVYQSLSRLVEDGHLPDYESEELDRLRQWFNDNLEAPWRLARSRRPNAASKAICWFKESAHEHLSKMHAICRLLNENGIKTEMISTMRPGYIVYEDEHQVAAVPFGETRT